MSIDLHTNVRLGIVALSEDIDVARKRFETLKPLIEEYIYVNTAIKVKCFSLENNLTFTLVVTDARDDKHAEEIEERLFNFETSIRTLTGKEVNFLSYVYTKEDAADVNLKEFLR